jgi:hypothetical protein
MPFKIITLLDLVLEVLALARSSVFTTTCHTERELQPADACELGAAFKIRSLGCRTLPGLLHTFASAFITRTLIGERWDGAAEPATRHHTCIRRS